MRLQTKMKMKNIIGLMTLMIITLMLQAAQGQAYEYECEPYQDSYGNDEHYCLGEGEARDHSHNGKIFRVKLLIVEDTFPLSAVFEIDGEVTPQMSSGDLYETNNEFVLKLKGLSTNSGSEGDSVTYTIVEGQDYGHENDESRDRCIAENQKCEAGNHPETCTKALANCISAGQDSFTDEDWRYEVDREYGPEKPEKLFNMQPDCTFGCLVNSEINKCLPIGTRLEYEGVSSYCDLGKNIKLQKEDGTEANNNYECKSNSARYGVCENIEEQQSAMKKMFGWLSKLFGG